MYTNAWNEASPLGGDPANLLWQDIDFTKLDLRERLGTLFGMSLMQFAADPIVPQVFNAGGFAGQFPFQMGTGGVKFTDPTGVTMLVGIDAAGNIVGTSFTGIVHATAITGLVLPANGGTGVVNTDTITLGGNIVTAGAFSTSGAHALTLSLMGDTNITLPTSGTLITTGVTALTSLTSAPALTTVGILTAPHMTAPVVDSGGMTITAGGLLVTAGGGIFAAGDVTVSAGVLRFGAPTSGIVPGATNFVLFDSTGTIQNILYGNDGSITARGSSFSKHFSGIGGTPTLTNILPNTTAVGLTGTDAGGRVTFTTTSTGVAADDLLCTINFASSYGAAPFVALQQEGKWGSALQDASLQVENVTTTSFDVRTGATIPAGQTWSFSFIVRG